MTGIWLSMVECMDYVNGNDNSRCVREGEEVLNAGHIILYGKTEETRNHMKLIALCIQSSALYSDPHKVLGTLAIEPKNRVKIVNMTCTCKAGLGGLIDLSKLDAISQTDPKCVWSKQKGSVQEKYKAVPLSQMPCLKKVVNSDIAVCSEDFLRDIASLLPECAINRLRVGRSSPMMKLYSENITFQSDCCEKLFATLMNENQDDVIGFPQNSATWHDLRKFRVTGSRCYELYTYSGQSWDTKAQKYFWPKSFSNKYVKHGLKYEDDAR